MIAEPRNWSIRRRLKSSLRAPRSASPVASPITAPVNPPHDVEFYIRIVIGRAQNHRVIRGTRVKMAMSVLKVFLLNRGLDRDMRFAWVQALAKAKKIVEIDLRKNIVKFTTWQRTPPPRPRLGPIVNTRRQRLSTAKSSGRVPTTKLTIRCATLWRWRDRR